MKLKIISPEDFQEFEVVWVEMETPGGNIVIMEGHAPMIATLEPNKQITFCYKNGKQENIINSGGIAEVTRDFVNILCPQKN